MNDKEFGNSSKVDKLSKEIEDTKRRVCYLEEIIEKKIVKIDHIYNAVVGDPMRPKGIRQEVDEHSEFISKQKTVNNKNKGAYKTLTIAGAVVAFILGILRAVGFIKGGV